MSISPLISPSFTKIFLLPLSSSILITAVAIPASAFTSSLFISSIPSGRIILILLVYSGFTVPFRSIADMYKNATSLHPASSSLPLISISQSNFTGGSGVNTDSSFIFSPLLNAVALSSPFSNSSILNVNGGCFRFVEFLSLSGFCLPMSLPLRRSSTSSALL